MMVTIIKKDLQSVIPIFPSFIMSCTKQSLRCTRDGNSFNIDESETVPIMKVNKPNHSKRERIRLRRLNIREISLNLDLIA